MTMTCANSIILGVKRNTSFISRLLEVLQGDAVPVTISDAKYWIKTCGLDRHVPHEVTVRESVIRTLGGDLFLDDAGFHYGHKSQDDYEEREGESFNPHRVRDEKNN